MKMKMETAKISFIIAIVLSSCNYQKTVVSNNSISKRDVVKNESFDDFYKEFDEDSLFQIKRITFPLKGIVIDGDYNPDEGPQKKVWRIKDWNYFTFSKCNYEFEVKFDKSDTVVKEYITIPDSGYEIIREFKLIESKWYLVFLSQQNL